MQNRAHSGQRDRLGAGVNARDISHRPAFLTFRLDVVGIEPKAQCTSSMSAGVCHLPDAEGCMSRAERFRLVRELGSRAVPTWAALDSQGQGRNALVVVERIARGGDYGDAEIGDWVRDARRLGKLEHPNVAQGSKTVVIRGDEVLVASDYVDGVKWSEFGLGPQRPSLEVTLRVFVDVLAGLGALHDLRDEAKQPLRLMHGELTPECVIVGPEGMTRVVSACRVRSAIARPGRAGSAYLAPEILLADDSADSRADVYSVGVMLWEAHLRDDLSSRTPNPPPSSHTFSAAAFRVQLCPRGTRGPSRSSTS